MKITLYNMRKEYFETKFAIGFTIHRYNRYTFDLGFWELDIEF